jgi:hypothetical protein
LIENKVSVSQKIHEVSRVGSNSIIRFSKEEDPL